MEVIYHILNWIGRRENTFLQLALAALWPSWAFYQTAQQYNQLGSWMEIHFSYCDTRYHNIYRIGPPSTFQEGLCASLIKLDQFSHSPEVGGKRENWSSSIDYSVHKTEYGWIILRSPFCSWRRSVMNWQSNSEMNKWLPLPLLDWFIPRFTNDNCAQSIIHVFQVL